MRLELLSIQDVADLSGFSLASIFSEIKAGRLHGKYSRQYGGWFIKGEDYLIWARVQQRSNSILSDADQS